MIVHGLQLPAFDASVKQSKPPGTLTLAPTHGPIIEKATLYQPGNRIERFLDPGPVS